MRLWKLLGLALIVLPLASCGQEKARAELLGLWKTTDAKNPSSVRFSEDGTVAFSGKAGDLLDWKYLKLIQDFNMQPPRNALKFKVVNTNRVKITGDFTALAEKLSGGAEPGTKAKINLAEFQPEGTLTFAVAGNELTLTGENGKSMSFRKAE